MTAFRNFAIAVALTAAAAGSALAQEATPDSWLQSVTSTKTRAEVVADLQAARASGLTKAWSAGYMEPVKTNLLRAQVQAETQRAIASGELAAINAEAYGTVPAAAALRVTQSAR